MPDLGFQGCGSVSLDLLVEVRDDEGFDLGVDVDATLSSSGLLGREYELRGSLVRSIPGNATE